jgi:hypothetical protein
VPRMTPEEFEADLLRARADGAQEIATLIESMTKLGLPLSAVAGALGGVVAEMAATADAAKLTAEASRAPKAEPADPAE